MTDLTLNDFSGIPADKTREILRYEADRIYKNDISEKKCLKKVRRSSFLLDSFKRYHPKYLLSFNRP